MHIMILILFLAGWGVCIRKPNGRKNIFGKAVLPIYQISAGIWSMLRKYMEKTSYIRRLEERLVILHPNMEKGKLVEEFICYKLSMALTILLAATLVSFLLVMREKQEQVSVSQLERESYWGLEKEETLVARADGMEEEVTIQVPEQKYKEEEIQNILKEMAVSLEKTVLKNNKTLDCVTTDLNFVTTVEGTQIEVNWAVEPDGYVNYDGTLVPGAVTEAGAIVNLTATLSYENQTYLHSFALHLQKPELSKEEQFRESILRELESLNASSVGAKVLELPKEVQGKEVSFAYQKDAYGYKLFAALLFFAVLFFFMKDEKLQTDLEKRKKQMLTDYPEVVSKLMLLLGAGMTIRLALEKIASDYDNKVRMGICARRFVYDEILYICREMQGGISERVGIDFLGKRCQIPCYTKMCSLISQNLKKGSKGMAEALSYEVSQAFEERKNIARKLGEEAGTKLLFPMILMLGIVMVVLMVPACLSF